LTPNLAIADSSAQVIYFLNPSSPGSIQTFPILQPGTSGAFAYPTGVSVSDAGMVYYETVVEGGSGFHAFFKLNTATGAIKDYGLDGPDSSVDGFPLDTEAPSIGPRKKDSS